MVHAHSPRVSIILIMSMVFSRHFCRWLVNLCYVYVYLYVTLYMHTQFRSDMTTYIATRDKLFITLWTNMLHYLKPGTEEEFVKFRNICNIETWLQQQEFTDHQIHVIFCNIQISSAVKMRWHFRRRRREWTGGCVALSWKIEFQVRSWERD